MTHMETVSIVKPTKKGSLLIIKPFDQIAIPSIEPINIRTIAVIKPFDRIEKVTVVRRRQELKAITTVPQSGDYY